MEFSNSYEDAKRAEAYAKLEFPGTYYLAYRDLPEITAVPIVAGSKEYLRWLHQELKR